jgi:hypothetical protein
MDEVVQWLPNKHMALSSNTRTAKKFFKKQTKTTIYRGYKLRKAIM